MSFEKNGYKVIKLCNKKQIVNLRKKFIETFKLASTLNNSINIDVQLSEGSLKSKLRRANKDNASYALIIGEDEIKSESIIVKSLLDENSEQLVMDFKDLENFIKKIK